MSLKTSIVGVQVKHVKGALQYLAKIGGGACYALFLLCFVRAGIVLMKRNFPAGSEILIEALPEKVSTPVSAYSSMLSLQYT